MNNIFVPLMEKNANGEWIYLSVEMAQHSISQRIKYLEKQGLTPFSTQDVFQKDENGTPIKIGFFVLAHRSASHPKNSRFQSNHGGIPLVMAI